ARQQLHAPIRWEVRQQLYGLRPGSEIEVDPEFESQPDGLPPLTRANRIPDWGEACSDSRQLASMPPVRGRRHRKSSDNVLVELCAWSLIGMPAGFQDPPTPHRFPAHAFEPGGAPSRLRFPAD